MANNAKHWTLRMKTPKGTCAFMSGCNDTFNRSKLQEGQACACYSPIDPGTSERVDCSSLIDEVTNQALHDKTQKLFKSGGRKAVVEYRNECRAMWLASKRGTAAADEGEAAQEHSTGASSAESTAEGHGLGISDSSASEDMLEVSTDSDSDWRNDTDTTDSESEAPQARQPPLLLASDELYPERTVGSGEGALSAMATPENDALHKLTEAKRASHSAGNLHLAKYFAGAAALTVRVSLRKALYWSDPSSETDQWRQARARAWTSGS
jgi:hypothetical protein